MMGIRELFLVALVALALYGRSGVLKSQKFQTIRPWITPVRRPSSTSASARRNTNSSAAGGGVGVEPRSIRGARFVLQGNRLFWFLTILAATAVAAWIVTRTMIVSGANGFR